jgi:hypothetical protein
MSFIIASERLGIIGEQYIPKDGTNIDALLAGGFIVESEVSTTEEEKPAKTKPKKASKE